MWAGVNHWAALARAAAAMFAHSSSWARHHSMAATRSDPSAATGTWSSHGTSLGKNHMSPPGDAGATFRMTLPRVMSIP